MSGSDEEIRDESETASAPEITVTTDLDSHLTFSSVPRRRRPATAERDRARAVEGRRTRSSSRAPPEAGLVWPVPREATRATGAATTSMQAKAGAAEPVPPVLRPLADKQLEVAQMSDTQAAAYENGTKDAFQLVKGAGHFPLAPGAPGASHAAMQGVSSIVNVVCSYHLLGIKSEGKAQLLVQAAFSAELRHIWHRAWSKAPISTSGYGEGSQLFCALRNLLVVFTTIAEKQRILDAKSAFRYSPQGFEATRMAIEQIFEEFDHAVACTADFKVCFRLSAMTDAQKIFTTAVCWAQKQLCLSLFTRRTGRQWAYALAGSHCPSRQGHQESYHPTILHSNLLESARWGVNVSCAKVQVVCVDTCR